MSDVKDSMFVAVVAALVGLSGCGNEGGTSESDGAQGDAGCLFLSYCAKSVEMGASTGSTTEMTTSSSTGGGVCGDSVVDPDEACDDGTDCADGVCNANDYTGKEHCNDTCDGKYPGWCGDKVQQPGHEECDKGGNDMECDADCTVPVCGDGIFNPNANEACDDGPSNSDAYDDTPDQVACNASCMGKAPHCGDDVCQPNEDRRCSDCTCGDGIVSSPENCDDGNMVDDEDCDFDCTSPVCGDGHINTAAGELCDDGNLVDDDTCRNNCTSCGDGVLQPGEACDDSNQVDDDACSNACVLPKLAFVTSDVYQPAMTNGPKQFKGVAGADAACKAHAQAAGLAPTTWVAWLSDGTSSPAQRMAKDNTFSGWYRLPDGTPLAQGWSDLTDGTLLTPLNLTESQGTPALPLSAWTNTKPDGTVADPTNHCSGWTLADDLKSAIRGSLSAKDATWSNNGTFACAGSFHLYCFEVTP